MIATSKLKRIADQKLSTVNPGTNAEARSTRIALITIKNNPSVIMVIGSVNKIRSGFKRALKTPSTNATRSAVQKLTTCTPGKIYEAMMTISALASQLRSIPIFFSIAKFRTCSRGLDWLLHGDKGLLNLLRVYQVLLDFDQLLLVCRQHIFLCCLRQQVW